MPFVQRVVQPVHISQACSFISASGNKATKFNCILDTCQHRHYANKKQPLNELHQVIDSSVNTQRERSTHESPALIGETASYRVNVKSGVHLEVSPTEECSPVTKVIVHGNSIETQRSSPHCFDVTDNSNSAVTSSSFASSCYINASETAKHNVYSSLFPTPEIPIKKLKEHVEFLSSATSPVRSQHTSISTSAKGCMNSISTISKSRSAAVIVAGHEFDSISNITLSNALRQLASLVLIASDIFADLHKELRIVGERARVVQNKIITVERSVSDYDPKTVTVPESDLLTIAQRKIHYECDKSYHKELFTIDTRPCSVYVLYEEAGKVTSGLKTHSSQTAEHSSFTGLSSFACDHVINSESPYIRDINCSAFGSNDFSHSPFRVNNLCKMRFDADIEISLPAAIEDLRKWTSTEAVGDVTVTPDCIHHVDALSDAYFLISENATLSLALSPSIPSTDAFDAISVNNINQGVNINNLTNDNNKDVPLNHRLPSPEEQSKIIALKYPAEVISVDVSGKRFQRMCMARKSTTSCISNASNTNNLNSDVQTVSRRSRSRRARGKRRNTIAGTDQKEIQDAASGETTAAGDEIEVIMAESDVGSKEPKYNLQNKTKRFGRSKSSDILKKESATLTYDKGKGTLTRLNSLKQWGRSRFKFMQRNNETPSCSMPVNESDTEHKTCPVSVNTDTKQKNAGDINSATAGVTNSFVENMSHNVVMEKNETVAKQCVNVMEKDRNESRFSHERKPSYSSSEKSVNVNNVGHARGKFHLNPTGGNVKLRDNSSLNRRRNCCLNVNGLSNKEDQPHSSSGNWSASSESGRASIGSEITLQPKSSASNTSLNAFSYQAGSGPPSSMFSRRKFLNTSASSSVTSEGTATPDLQVISTTIESVYSNHLDDETSSAYSCDTEGYYTSFHMDSGLRTLKEEDVCMANFQQGSQPLSLCSYAQDYNSSANNSQQTLIAENEYELFGHGSTSTTTSSAGTVCTTLVGNNTGAELNLNNSGTSCGPELPERVSSLRSSSASASTLERSISSSTIGSGVERTGTIKRNASTVLSTSHLEDMTLSSPNPASQLECASQMEEPKKRDPHHLPVADVDYSESSDLEGIERIERIKQKTAINARHIPSMCIITPTTSDDENQHFYGNDEENNAIQFNKNFQANAAKNKAAKLSLLNTQTSEIKSLTKEAQVKEKSTIDEIKSAIPFIKGAVQMSLPSTGLSVIEDDVLYDTAGEYVYIAADTNNKVNNKQLSQMSNAGTGSSLGIYYANNLTKNGKDLEYVSLNELPFDLRRTHGGSNKGPKIEFSERNKEKSGTHCADAYQIQNSQGTALYADIDELQRETWRTSPCKTNTPPPSTTSSPFVSPHKGARVRLNSVGKPIYDSDSLKRRKGAHTTFIPGPYVKEENESQYTQLQLNNSESDSSAVKLLLLYADNKANYKMAGVKSINNRLTTTRPTISTTSNTNEDGNSHVITCESNKSFLYQQPISNHSLIHSPSTKSNCSSSCSIVSSTTSSSKSSFSSKDEGYKPFYQTGGELQKQEEEHGHRELENMCMSYSMVERNSPVYWTLQNKRCNREQMISSISRDDLYATPLKRSDRKLRSSNIERQGNTKNNVSSTVHGNRMGILTSTPMRKDVNDSGAPIKQHSARSLLWDDNSPDRLNTCADRIGHSKTSLMDFKRLLLAKSVKSNTLPKNLSAVEMLKKTNLTSSAHNAGNARTTCANTDTSPGVSPGSPTSKINSSLNLLDLSGSPKTFANRRMLRQGQFGSPSKSFTPKLKNSPGGWRANSALRTDIMSTIIPESNSEEDHSTSATDESNVIKNCGSLKDNSKIDEKEKIGSSENFKRKEKEKNIFLQNEENNFMRGELRSSFGKNKTCFESPAVIMPSTCSENLNASDCNISIPVMTDATIDAIEPSSKFVITPALETAL